VSVTVYRGPDRRRPVSLSRGRLPGPRALLLVGLAASIAVVGVELLAATSVVSGLTPVSDTFGIVATALFFGAGSLRHARWRATGEAYMAVSSAALVVFALSTFPVVMAARAFVDPRTAAVLSSLARFAAAGVVTLILAPSLRAVEVDSRVRPHRLAIAGSVVAFVVFVGTAGLLEMGDPRLLTSSPAAAALELATSALWWALAWLCMRAGWNRRSPSLAWTAAVLALLGVATLLRSVSRFDGASWQIAAAVLIVVAASVAVANAAADLHEALAGESTELLTATSALADAQRLLADVEARREELVHDAGSMIATLRAASTTLDRHADVLDFETARWLRDAMGLELERLDRLIQGDVRRPPERFELAGAVRPVLATLREEGLDLEDLLEPRWAFGRPEDLAEVVHNLVVNAGRHAPGSTVTLRCDTVGPSVRLLVEDRGPGVRPDLVDRLFERGVTSDPSAGKGLGLHIGRRLMREQGGDLEVQDRPGGGASFVASLPAAPVVVETDGVGPQRATDPVVVDRSASRPAHGSATAAP
jgi:signal transduction histidine kinase